MNDSQFVAYLEKIWSIPPEEEQKLLDESFEEDFAAWYRGDSDEDEYEEDED